MHVANANAILPDSDVNSHHASFANFWREYKQSREFLLDKTPVMCLRMTSKVIKDVLGDKVMMNEEDESAAQFDPPDDTFLGDFSEQEKAQIGNERWEFKGTILNDKHPLFERPINTELDKEMWDLFGDDGKNRFPQEIPNFIEGHGSRIKPVITLMPGHEHDYPNRAPRKLDKIQQKELLTQIKYYLDKGWIKPSSSPYGACVLFVPKKNGKFRMCFDYRGLNKITVKDKYPLPDAEQVVEQLQGAKYFSQLDLSHGYHQCVLAPEDIEKTTFRTMFGAYEWNVLTFGFCNAVPAFIRLMNNTLHKLLGRCVMVFVDDVVIYSQTKDQHRQDCIDVMNALDEADLYVNWVKSQFDVREIYYLGLKISSEGVSPFEDKVATVKEWERPESIYHLRSFLGAVGYYRKFIYNFAKIARPLTDLTKDNDERDRMVTTNITMAKFGRDVRTQRLGDNEWTTECQDSFEALKQAMCNAPVLQLPDPKKSYEVMIDASKVASGAVLMQRDAEGNLHPVAFYSSKHTGAESNYPVHEFELLAIFKALKQWRHLLVGSDKTIIYTDHKPLTHILSQDKLSSRQERWITYLADYDVDILAVEGTSNKVADCLSRYNYSDLTDLADELRNKFVHTVKLAHQTALGLYVQYAHMYALCGFEMVSALQPSVVTHLDFDALETAPIFGGGRNVNFCEPDQEESIRYATYSSLTAESIRTSLKESYSLDPLAKRVLEDKSVFVDLKLVNGMIIHIDRDGHESLYIPKCAMISNSQLQTEFPVEGDTLRPQCSVREELLRDIHNNGHVGTGKMIELVRRLYYWPRMRLSISDYVRGCKTCQQNKSRTHKEYGRLRTLELPTRRWGDINIDFIVALPRSRGGFDSIMVVIDRLSKRAHFIPTKTTATAEYTAQLFYENVWKLHGLPLKIISDRDKLFTSDFWRSLMKVLGSKLAMTTPFHPQTDGLVERTNLTLKEMLRSFTENGGLDWEKYLPAAEFVYNNTYNSSVKATPFQVDTNQNPIDSHAVLLEDILKRLADDDDFNCDDSAKEFYSSWEDKLLIAKQALRESSEAMTHRFDTLQQRINTSIFKVGTKVWLDGTNIKVSDRETGKAAARKSLDKRRMGPYTILEVLGDGTAFKLELPSHQKFHNVQSISRLEPIKESSEFPEAHVETPYLPVVIDDVEEYEVESILRHKTERGVRKYLVKFLGYDNSKNQWLRREQLANAQEYLEEYELRQGTVGETLRRSGRTRSKAVSACRELYGL